MTALADTAGDARLVERRGLQMNPHHDDLIAESFCLSDEVDLGRVRIDRLKAEAHTLLQLGLLAQGALVAQGRNTPSSKVPMAVCIS